METMKTLELYKALTEIIPTTLSYEWDSDGLEVCPDLQKEVKRILISLDVTEEVIDKAVKEKYDVILAHHPLFFKGVDSLNAEVPQGRRAVKLIQGNVAIMTFHTRMDCVADGVNDVLARTIGLKDIETVYDGNEQIVRIGTLDSEMPAEDFARLVKFALGASCIQLTSCGKPAYKVAVLGGSGDSGIGTAMRAGADTYLTGDLKYHNLLCANDVGMNIMTAGHFYTEFPVTSFLKEQAEKLCPDADVDIFFSDRIQII